MGLALTFRQGEFENIWIVHPNDARAIAAKLVEHEKIEGIKAQQ